MWQGRPPAGEEATDVGMAKSITKLPTMMLSRMSPPGDCAKSQFTHPARLAPWHNPPVIGYTARPDGLGNAT